ncbi:uncharacterized protein F4822DRAFT_108410 [Hypoxylon trugodes]|uniref:uncharacterized protein n=1 Tax=Hypoxylon trugodes TaxID=326681 RepID=UPI002192879A|nr:uncharacterized protein F4822DRAFT_108410 [Hypoxylon trugodes]KAI1391877.1 hypothetical protein F4822DRAFT_108410 [Hypoxylon trugodes]
MEPEFYSLADILAVANIHPFYVFDVKYPPNTHIIQIARKRALKQVTEEDLKLQPLLRKKSLYTTIRRLIDDTSPLNTFRQGIYASISGGASESKPLFFATDVHENRRHRAYFGRFLHMTGVVKPGDWVLSVHAAGELYRSLDLTLEILENAGASVLSAGNHMSPAEVCTLLADYHVNVLSGASSQVVHVVHHISTLPDEKRAQIKLDKIIYTSETLTRAQRGHIYAILGPVKICSMLGSAEAGPWAISNPDLIENDITASHANFIFDTRATLIETLSASVLQDDPNPNSVPDGRLGIIAQTSLTRLRNPLVRYLTGDIGSLHPLPDDTRSMIPKEDWPYLRVLRLAGRDRRFSFEWDGDYVEFEELTFLIESPECGVLQWQVVLDKMQPSLESSLEIRLLCSPRENESLLIYEYVLIDRIRAFFHVYSANEHRFHIVLVKNLDDFERSTTGRKVIKFIDRYN